MHGRHRPKPTCHYGQTRVNYRILFSPFPGYRILLSLLVRLYPDYSTWGLPHLAYRDGMANRGALHGRVSRRGTLSLPMAAMTNVGKGAQETVRDLARLVSRVRASPRTPIISVAGKSVLKPQVSMLLPSIEISSDPYLPQEVEHAGDSYDASKDLQVCGTL